MILVKKNKFNGKSKIKFSLKEKKLNKKYN